MKREDGRLLIIDDPELAVEIKSDQVEALGYLMEQWKTKQPPVGNRIGNPVSERACVNCGHGPLIHHPVLLRCAAFTEKSPCECQSYVDPIAQRPAKTEWFMDVDVGVPLFSNKAARTLSGVTFTAKLQGAVHSDPVPLDDPEDYKRWQREQAELKPEDRTAWRSSVLPAVYGAVKGIADFPGDSFRAGYDTEQRPLNTTSLGIVRVDQVPPGCEIQPTCTCDEPGDSPCQKHVCMTCGATRPTECVCDADQNPGDDK